MNIATTIRDLVARLRSRRVGDLERDIDAAEDARRRGTKPLDASQGVLHPPQDPSTWTGGV